MPSPSLNNEPKTDIAQFVETMALDGYATFPTNNKRPLHGGESWKDAPVDMFPTSAAYPRGEYGIVLRSDDLIVDIDPRNFPEGRRCWSEFCAKNNLPSLNKSKIVRTGSGGMHIYLKKPPEFKVRKNLPEYPGLDFLSVGNYVIGPGSKVPDSNYSLYQIICDGNPMIAPKELLNALIKPVQEYTDIVHEGFRDTIENISRFVDYLNTAEVAVEGRSGDQLTFKTACRGRDFNLSPQACFQAMLDNWNPKCSPPWLERDLYHKVANAYRYNVTPAGTKDPHVVLPNLSEEEEKKKWLLELDCTGVGTYKPSFKNAVLLLNNDKNLKNKFAFNQFNYKIELIGNLPWEKRRVNVYREINDLEVGHIALYLAQTYKIEFPLQKVWEAIAIAAGDSTRHPIKEWLDLLVWDRKPRLEDWLSTYCGAFKTPYSQAIGKKTLTAAVARIYNPGIKFDTVLILEGEQGTGKSTACAILGGRWFGDALIDVNNMKDTIEYVHSHWIIEFSEMASTRKADVNKLKNFLSSAEDDARPAYARVRIRFPRQSIFIGTVNPDNIGYLTDDTGNRRFWPVTCSKFDLERLRSDRDQIFAEARDCYKAGETLYLPNELAKKANMEAMERLVKDPWLDIIAAYIGANPDIAEITTEEIYSKVIGGNYLNMHTGHSRRIASALRILNFRMKRGRRNAYCIDVKYPALDTSHQKTKVEVNDPFAPIK